MQLEEIFEKLVGQPPHFFAFNLHSIVYPSVP